jgi:phage terminase large subunit GpA-like protein
MSSSLVEETRRRATSKRILASALTALRPPPSLTISQWADTERRLSPESSASPGKWRTSRAEYQRGFMDAISDVRNRRVVGVFASQTGKTDCVLNVVGYHIHYDPAPILMIQPTLEIAEAWSKDRLAPMLRDTPALRERMASRGARDSGNTIRHRSFRGGHLTAAGANSPASLASRPIRILLCDEVERYPPSAGSEGSPLQLAATRTAGFWNAKEVYISSPGHKGSAFEELWLKSDQRRFFVPCGECEHFQTLRWPQVDFKDETGESVPELAVYVCEACGARWDDVDRWTAVERGEWRATAPFSGTAGFHVNALAAPWESRKLASLARQWLDAQGNNELLKVFVGTVLAEWWEERYETLQPAGLEARREQYPVRENQVLAPPGVAVITAGVDVQDDRIEVQIQGYGSQSESWKLQYHVLQGDPTATVTWQALWELLLRPIPMARGGHDFIRATCVDTGAHAIKAYDFCRPRFRYLTADGFLGYVFAIKARGGPGRLWPIAPRTNNKGKIPLFTVQVDAAKELIYASLAKIHEPGPGFIHFPAEVTTGRPFDRAYFAQLTSEKVTPRRNPNGTVSRVWEKKSERARNEALDTSVYGEAALQGLIQMGLDLEAEAERWNAQAPQPAPKPKTGRPNRSTSQWLNRDG